MASIRLDCVDKVFPNGQAATRGLTLEVADGEFLVLLGPSGCGKTTALRLIAGLESPTAGRIYLDGRDITDLPPRHRDLAMVFQNHALYPHLTVRHNLSFGLRMRGTSPAVIAERVSRAARSLGIEALLDRPPAQLSGGQRQRVALGRAIAREPRAFLLDEPLSNLDARLRVEIRDELSRLQRRLGTTMIHVTHDQEEAMAVAHRVAVLRDGRLEQVGAPMDVYHRPVNRFVAGFVGAPAMNFVPATVPAGVARVESPWFTLPLPPRAATLGPREVTLGVRPRDLSFDGDGDAIGRVEMVQPLGNDRIVHLTLTGAGQLITVVVAALAGGPALGPGLLARLRFSPDRLHLFDALDGTRIDLGG